MITHITNGSANLVADIPISIVGKKITFGPADIKYKGREYTLDKEEFVVPDYEQETFVNISLIHNKDGDLVTTFVDEIESMQSRFSFSSSPTLTQIIMLCSFPGNFSEETVHYYRVVAPVIPEKPKNAAPPPEVMLNIFERIMQSGNKA